MLVNSRPWLPIQKVKSLPRCFSEADPAEGSGADDDEEQGVEQHVDTEFWYFGS